MDNSVLDLTDFMIKGKSFLDYSNLFSPNDYEKNDKIILKYFQYEIWDISILKIWKSFFALFVVHIENFKNLKYHTS